MQAPMTIKQYVSQMRKIPGGRFTMGRTYEVQDESGFYIDEMPAHPVDISPFRMGATPITVGIWREYVRANKGLAMPQLPEWDWIDSHPMVNISWTDIMGTFGWDGFCHWASTVTGTRLTLPTEAQWEYVARSGRNVVYPWGTTFEPKKLWFEQSQTGPVNRRNQIYTNEWGCADIVGNVCHWCIDWYGPYEGLFRDRLGYKSVPSNPTGPRSGRERCLRGGSWFNLDPDIFRCTQRGRFGPDSRYDKNGFRLVAPPK